MRESSIYDADGISNEIRKKSWHGMPLYMKVRVTSRLSRDGQKKWYYFEWGKEAGQRMAAGVFTYASPTKKDQKAHNKEAKRLLEYKKANIMYELSFQRNPKLALTLKVPLSDIENQGL